MFPPWGRLFSLVIKPWCHQKLSRLIQTTLSGLPKNQLEDNCAFKLNRIIIISKIPLIKSSIRQPLNQEKDLVAKKSHQISVTYFCWGSETSQIWIRKHFSWKNIQKELPASVPLLARSRYRLKWALYQGTDPKDLTG